MEFRSKALKETSKPHKQSRWKRNTLIIAFGAATCLAMDGYIQVKAAVDSVSSAVHGMSYSQYDAPPANK